MYNPRYVIKADDDVYIRSAIDVYYFVDNAFGMILSHSTLQLKLLTVEHYGPC